MNINISIQLAEGDTLGKSSDEVANDVLSAVGGNPEKDFCTVSIMQPMDMGTAGTQAIPPPPPALEAAPEADTNGEPS